METIRLEVEGNYDDNYCLIKDDHAELWGHNVSFHPWKDRTYAPVLVKIITVDEAHRLHHQYVAEKKAEADERAAKADERSKRYELLASLAGTYGNLILDDRGEITDDYGNYLFSLPFDIPADVAGWIKSKFNNFLEEEEYYD